MAKYFNEFGSKIKKKKCRSPLKLSVTFPFCLVNTKPFCFNDNRSIGSFRTAVIKLFLLHKWTLLRIVVQAEDILLLDELTQEPNRDH